jgi:hypothetical protein
MSIFRVAALLLVAISQNAMAQVYHPEALSHVVREVKAVAAQGKKAIVLFDLDDTLINTRERTLRIIHDFARQGSDSQNWKPEHLAKLGALSVGDIHYQIADTLKAQGIADSDLESALSSFWLLRFFTNPYCEGDVQNLGAAQYTREVVQAGGTVIYLSGRDTPRMGPGTVKNLRQGGFPMEATNTLLMLKPDKNIPDFDFKRDSLAAIAAMGVVLGVFENEPANLNAMSEAFPSAQAIFLDTIHSPAPAEPVARAQWVKDFARSNESFFIPAIPFEKR